jgi:Holliday junction resolvasome RuvABC endonuclease subunit
MSQRIVSVDIGHQYLAYALLESEGNELTYGIYSFRGGTSCINRCECVVEFLRNMQPDYLIIEKQIGLNVKAIELQYALAAAGSISGAVIEIQPAWHKFEVLNEICITRGKAHKALSVKMALEWLIQVTEAGEIIDISETPLSQYEKQDDIADAINMLRTHLS